MAQAGRESISAATRLSSWAQRHVQEGLGALGRLSRRPFSTALTAIVIGITLALPLGLRIILINVDAANYSWESTLTMSAFLKGEVSAEDGRALADRLSRRLEVSSTRFISRDEALQEFRQLSGFADALDLLDENPLPAVIVIGLRADQPEAQITGLADELRTRPQVGQVQMDAAWLRRLQSIMDLGHRVVVVLGIMLGMAVIVTVGNTIRLDVQARRDEIVVMKLVGAPDDFVQRPFIYTGIWYGLLGGLLATFFLAVAMDYVAAPVAQLAGLYDSDFRMRGAGFTGTLAVLGIGPLLGLIGARLAVSVHISAAEPD